jgi:hypothetical protein
MIFIRGSLDSEIPCATYFSIIFVSDELVIRTAPMPSAKDPQTDWRKHAITIAAIKTIARNANPCGRQTTLQHAIAALEAIWTNDRAAQPFWTQLEQRQP